MAVYASIIFSEPMSADTLAVIAPPESPPSEILMSVATALDHFGVTHGADEIPVFVAEEAIDRLLGVVTGLTASCWREEDAPLAEAIELWLSERGRF